MQIQLEDTVPLAVLHSMDGHVITRTRMMKLSFLTETQLPETNSEIDVGFYPYDYGPYSQKLVGAIQKLDSQNVIDVSEKTVGNTKYAYNMPPNARTALTDLAAENNTVHSIVTTANEITDEYGDYSIRELLDHIYESYPEYTTKTPFF